MLCEVVRSGIGVLVNQCLGCNDLVGKIGIISDVVDGWFVGYFGNVVVVLWMGYDQFKLFGGWEFGVMLVLLIWIDYMCQVLFGKLFSERKLLLGIFFVDGDWFYDEFKGDDGVKILDVEVLLI